MHRAAQPGLPREARAVSPGLPQSLLPSLLFLLLLQYPCLSHPLTDSPVSEGAQFPGRAGRTHSNKPQISFRKQFWAKTHLHTSPLFPLSSSSNVHFLECLMPFAYSTHRHLPSTPTNTDTLSYPSGSHLMGMLLLFISTACPFPKGRHPHSAASLPPRQY